MFQVMVIDMLEGFTRMGPLASDRVGALLPQQAAFLQALPPQSLVVFVADEHDKDDFELKHFPPHCLRGTEEAMLCRELLDAAAQARAQTEIVRKHQFSGFFNTNLDEIINAAPTRQWIVFGCVTDCCIEANIAELVYRRCEVTVIRDLIDTWDMPADIARNQLTEAHAHDAEKINDEWFNRRLPAIWGVRVVPTWQKLISSKIKSKP
ncbi:MAG: hypothetical protein AMJ79_00425 [Phycisphaerae bacterium SM23_30]|nr:MAG: hypothetical protein AMJ79_00425 [Phycisphaerae bacterium SM23_30]